MIAEEYEDLEPLLVYLRDERGFDFTGYKRASLQRRVSKRIFESDCETPGEYLDYIQVHPEEVAHLFDTILINVTGFFRDAEHWEHLRTEVIAGLAEAADERGLRIWSAGCSSGEEAYTLAMLIAEELGEERLRNAVKIYATDIDNDALVTARAGTYTLKDLEAVPEEYRERYCESVSGRYAFRRDLRRSIVFGRHDLVADAPISRLDLIVCRNVLMYFTTEAQARILQRLHFGLRPDGHVFLGRAEMLLARTTLFEPVALRHRLFRPAPDTSPRTSPRLPPGDAQTEAVPPQLRQVRLRDLAFSTSPDPTIVIDGDGVVAMVNASARTLLGIRQDLAGRRFSELEISYRPVDLSPHLADATNERRQVTLTNVARVDAGGDVQHLDVLLSPMVDQDGQVAGTSVVFRDVSRHERLRAELQRSNHDLETAYEELLTTNEELQSTIEELETTNEELQSANEELETMNEELQSSNIEQEEVNDQLTMRTRELDQSNGMLEAILSAMSSGVIVTDVDHRVRVWDRTSAETWGLRADEVDGHDVRSLDFGLPVDELVPALATTLATGTEQTLSLTARNRLGRAIACTIRTLPLGPADATQGVVTLVDAGEADEE